LRLSDETSAFIGVRLSWRRRQRRPSLAQSFNIGDPPQTRGGSVAERNLPLVFSPTRRHCIGLGISAVLPPALAAGATASAARTAEAPEPHLLLVNADAREGLDLSGPWTFSIDPYRDGLFGFHGEAAGSGHRRFDDRDVETTMRENPTALFEYDMRRSPSVSLPSSWITHNPTMRHYDGLVWYQRAFTAPAARRGRAFVRIGAANYATRVYLNGALIGQHEGGFTPFAFEVTQWMRDGENRVTLGVDSQRTNASIPPPVTDWETYGGVTRGVRLVLTADTFIDDSWVRLTGDGRLAATIRLDGPAAAGGVVRVSIPALGAVMGGRAGPDGVWSGHAAVPKGLELWSPDSPTLYDVVVEGESDILRDRIGFRNIAVHGEDILLNGEPIFLRGICLHEEEFGPEPTRDITPEAARALLSEAKTGLNANFVRLAHYPHSEVTTRLADELGLLVWSEIPVYWRVDFANPDTLFAARRTLAENILRDRNRASIILWSVGNETPISDERNAFLATLAADVRALDDTRLVTAALLTERHKRGERPEMIINDPLVAHLDVMAVNTYNGWYTDDPLESLPQIVWRSANGKPMIFSEFGADALAGFHDPDRQHKFSEEFQAEYFRQTLAMTEKIPFLRGISPWILKDFRSPRRQHPVYQQGWNRKGLVSPTGQRKQAFHVLADHYRRLADAHGAPI
jgi:beta-glucuronidase